MDNHLFRFREKEDLSYIVIDVETEGLTLGGFVRSWEIAWIVVENGIITNKYQKFPWIPDLKVSTEAARVTGFNYSEYKSKSEPAEQVMDLLESYLYNPKYYIVGQNILNFDTYMISSMQKYLNRKINYSFVNRIYDTLSLGRAYKLGVKFPTDKQNITPFMYQMANHHPRGLKANLQQLCKDFGVEYFGHHIGLEDVKMTGEIFKKLYWTMDIH